MILISKEISKNFVFEISFFHKLRNFKDGISFLEFDVNLDLYKGDHNPQFEMCLVILNFKIFETNIYNINHGEMI
jgi:hypothetical protein